MEDWYLVLVVQSVSNQCSTCNWRAIYEEIDEGEEVVAYFEALLMYYILTNVMQSGTFNV